MNYFDKTTFDLGDVRSDEVVDFEFKFVKEHAPIEYCHTGCSCTKLDEFPVDSVKGTVDVSATGYKARNNQVYRVINVMFDDGLPEYVANDVGKAIRNPKKLTEKLVIIGNVIDK
jgi:hypothetical protein